MWEALGFTYLLQKIDTCLIETRTEFVGVNKL